MGLHLNIQFSYSKNFLFPKNLSLNKFLTCIQITTMRFRQTYHLMLYHNFGKGLYECWIL